MTVDSQLTEKIIETEVGYGETEMLDWYIWITVSLLSPLLIAGKKYWVYPSSLHPPAWPNIYIWGSVIIPQAAPQPPPMLGGNSKKTHNGIYLLCLPGPGVNPGDGKSTQATAAAAVVLNLVITSPGISYHLEPLLSTHSIFTRLDRYLRKTTNYLLLGLIS